jgi:hypothetical protein
MVEHIGDGYMVVFEFGDPDRGIIVELPDELAEFDERVAKAKLLPASLMVLCNTRHEAVWAADRAGKTLSSHRRKPIAPIGGNLH